MQIDDPIVAFNLDSAACQAYYEWKAENSAVDDDEIVDSF